MRLILLCLLACLLLVSQHAPAQATAYRNPTLSVETRTQDLLQRMTTEEKTGQLQSGINALGAGDSIAGSGVGSLAITPWSLKASAAESDRK